MMRAPPFISIAANSRFGHHIDGCCQVHERREAQFPEFSYQGLPDGLDQPDRP